MYKKDFLYVLTILTAIEKIIIYTKSFNDSDEFFKANDQMNFNAVLNLLIAIGEDSGKISKDIKDDFKNIDWKSIKGLRNELSHNYRGVDKDIIWDISKNYIPELKEDFKSIFILLKEKGGFQEEYIKKVLSTDYYKCIEYLLK